MSAIRVRWEPASDSRLTIAPVKVVHSPSEPIVVRPGEGISMGDAVSIEILAEVPGYDSYSTTVKLRGTGTTEVLIRQGDLIATAQDRVTNPVAQKARFRIRQWSPTGVTVWRTSRVEKEVFPRAASWHPAALELAAPQTPTRLVALPPTIAALGESTVHGAPVIVWESGPLGSRGPNVQPADSRASLIVDYLQNGQYDLAAAAATALQQMRGFAHVSDWVSASFEQLIIGYAFGLSDSVLSLERWCRRTAAAETLGPDGLLLISQLYWLKRDHHQALQTLHRFAASGPPTMALGVLLGLQLTTRYLGLMEAAASTRHTTSSPTAGSSKPELESLWRDLAQIGVDTAPLTATVSLPTTSASNTDISRSSRVERLAWRARYQLVRLRFRHSGQELSSILKVLGVAKGDRMSANSTSHTKLTGIPLYVAVAAVAIWLAFTIYMLTKTGAGEVTWNRIAWVFASVEAIAFAAAGALFGSAVQRERADKAEERADEATQVADENKDMAAKGRAFAADVQARAKAQATAGGELEAMGPGGEKPTDPTLLHLADVSRSLFGDLV